MAQAKELGDLSQRQSTCDEISAHGLANIRILGGSPFEFKQF